MKTISFNLAILFLALTMSIVSCKKDKEETTDQPTENAVPENFHVDIPDALSYSATTKSGQGDTLKGGEIYAHLRTFIKVGEGAAEIVQKVMESIRSNNINKAMELTYTSEDDNRAKRLKVLEQSEFDGKKFAYQLTISDVLNESNADGGKALQVFWNTKPVDGIAIICFANININDKTKYPNFMARIDYNELQANGYEQEMVVSISGFPLADPSVDPYSLKTIKMFAGKKGSVIDVYGNSNHPNAKFFANDEVGFNWAFVATSDMNANIGIAEVALPPSNLTATDRETILKTYSLRNVFNNQIRKSYPDLNQFFIDRYLMNTQAPGYFANSGFVAAGTAPTTAYSAIQSRMDKLTPYQPSYVSSMSINFKN